MCNFAEISLHLLPESLIPLLENGQQFQKKIVSC